jgi:type I restriction enzyme R subunit
MYLDRPIREAELLQAIARVNRTGHGKTAGIVVDYFGIAKHLKEALTAYSVEDIQGALKSLADEIPKLRDRHTRVMSLFESRNIDPTADAEAAVEALADERLRADFTVKLKQFLATLDLVLPGLKRCPSCVTPSGSGRSTLAHETATARASPSSTRAWAGRCRALIDAAHHLARYRSPHPADRHHRREVRAQLGRQVSDRAKASEMEHAIRHHIKKKLDEDPVHYQKLSERLEEILNKFGESWEQLAIALEGVRRGGGQGSWLWRRSSRVSTRRSTRPSLTS